MSLETNMDQGPGMRLKQKSKIQFGKHRIKGRKKNFAHGYALICVYVKIHWCN